jgi:hypothetical protein
MNNHSVTFLGETYVLPKKKTYVHLVFSWACWHSNNKDVSEERIKLIKEELYGMPYARIYTPTGTISTVLLGLQKDQLTTL